MNRNGKSKAVKSPREKDARVPLEDRSFGPDRRGEDSAGAKGKNRKRAVAASRSDTR